MTRASLRRAWQLLPRWFRRTLVITGGVVLLAIGAVFTVLPGPGIPFLVAALGLLALEFAWAEHRLNQLRHHSAKLTGAIRNRVRPGAEPEENTPETGQGEQQPGSEPGVCTSHITEIDLDGRSWCPNCRRFAPEPTGIDPSWWENQTGFEE